MRRKIESMGVRGLAVALLALLAVPAAADLTAGNGEVGIELGFTELDFDDDSTEFRWGVRGGYLFNQVFELEGQLWSTDGDVGGFDVTFNALFVNAVFNTHFREKRSIVPYGLIGLGALDAEIDGAGVKVDDTSLAAQLGAGSRFFVSRNLALRLELSMLFEDTFDDSAEHLSLVVGLTWRIRGDEPW